MNITTDKTIGYFDSKKMTVNLHKQGCNMLNVATGKKGKIPLTAADIDLKDFEERQIKVIRCKCMR